MAAYCWVEERYPRRMSSTGKDVTGRWGAGSSWSMPLLLRWTVATGGAWLETQSPKSLSAAARVGFSRPRAGVPGRERERRVDLPKEPDSATLRRERVLPEGASCLGSAIRLALEGS